MFKHLRVKALAIFFFFLPASTVLTSCDENSDETWWEQVLDFILSMLGWNPSTENVENQEQAVVIDEDEVSDTDFESKIDLSSYFPPIGNQGSYGTCVAWSSGYALKTALNAKSNGYTTSQLKNANYQCSPIDLWHLIPTSGKSTGCNGSNFEPALEAMMSSGPTTMASQPFTNEKMTCDGVTGTGGGQKLGGYRVIAYNAEMSSTGKPQGMNLSNFKYYLNAGYPILIGAQLGEKFMEWSSSAVINEDTDDYNGQHAYHAIVVTGYDDSKKAFRIRNSWGDDGWGDNGCIWVGYDHFFNQFCFGAWVAYNEGQELSSMSTNSASLQAGSANDLTAHVYSDVENADGTRTLTYDVENTGSSTISASKGWSVVYMLYNSNNLNDRVILFQDIYSDSKNAASKGVAVYPSEDEVTNVNIAAGESAASAQGGKKMQFTYKLPNTVNGHSIDGKYYMVMVVNPFESMSENKMNNNLSFVTAANNEPLVISGGKITNMPSSLKDVRDICDKAHHNTYKTNEILNMLAVKNKFGKLKKEVQSENTTLKSAKSNKKIVK